MSVHSIETLQALHAENTARINNASNGEILSILDDEISTYKKIVTDFFVEKKDELAHIYKSINTRAFPYNRIVCEDINTTRFEYGEYCEGMIAFVNKLLELYDGVSVNPELVNTSLGNISQRDQEFINSSRPQEEMDINNAMKNIEVLIDIYDDFTDFHNRVATMTEQIGKDQYSGLKETGVKILVNSIRAYNNHVIGSVLCCYDKIHESIQHRTPVSGDPETPQYALF